MAENSAEAANEATKSNAAVNKAIAESILEDGKSIRRGQWMLLIWLFCSWRLQLYWNYLTELHSQKEWEYLVS